MVECGPLVDLRPELDTREFRALLLLLVGWRKEHDRDLLRGEAAIRHYHARPDLSVLGFTRAGKPLAIVAIELDEPRHGVIHHIVVQPVLRQQGVGRALLDAVRAHLGLLTLRAETDHDAVGFYERSGFRTASLGEKYPGVERFMCTWIAAAQHDSGS